MLTKRFFNRLYLWDIVRFLIGGLILFSIQPERAFGATMSTHGTITITQFVDNITNTFTLIEKLVIMLAGLCGMVFMFLGVTKFKAHKENPAQIPLSTPIVLIAISSGLLFLPTMFGLIGSGLFGDAAQAGLDIF